MLHETHHRRIIQDLDNIVRTANIPRSMMYESATKFCFNGELEWLTKFPVYQRKGMGLVLTGRHNPSPDLKMMAMTAALVRNFVDARVITVQSLLDAHENGGVAPDPTVLLIPNLFVRQGGKGLPSWKMQIVYDILLARFTAGRLTVAYVENLDAMGAEYGQLFTQHLESSYLISQG